MTFFLFFKKKNQKIKKAKTVFKKHNALDIKKQIVVRENLVHSFFFKFEKKKLKKKMEVLNGVIRIFKKK